MKAVNDISDSALLSARERVICSMCGYQFDPTAHISCQGCPLQKGCQLVCCPACGFEMVDVQRSNLARLAGRWLKLKLDQNHSA